MTPAGAATSTTTASQRTGPRWARNHQAAAQNSASPAAPSASAVRLSSAPGRHQHRDRAEQRREGEPGQPPGALRTGALVLARHLVLSPQCGTKLSRPGRPGITRRPGEAGAWR